MMKSYQFFLLDLLVVQCETHQISQLTKCEDGSVTLLFRHMSIGPLEQGDVLVRFGHYHLTYYIDDEPFEVPRIFVEYFYYLLGLVRRFYVWIDYLMRMLGPPPHVPSLETLCKRRMHPCSNGRRNNIPLLASNESTLRRWMTSTMALITHGPLPSNEYAEIFIQGRAGQTERRFVPFGTWSNIGLDVAGVTPSPAVFFRGCPTMYHFPFNLKGKRSNTARDLPHILAIEALLRPYQRWYSVHGLDYVTRVEEYFVILINAHSEGKRRLGIIAPTRLHLAGNKIRGANPYVLETGQGTDFFYHELDVLSVLVGKIFCKKRGIVKLRTLKCMAMDVLFFRLMEKKADFTYHKMMEHSMMSRTDEPDLCRDFGSFMQPTLDYLVQLETPYRTVVSKRRRGICRDTRPFFSPALIHNTMEHWSQWPCTVFFFPLMVSPTRRHLISPALRRQLIALHGL